MSTLQIDVVQTEGAVICTLAGDGGAANAAALEQAVTRLCALRPHAVVIDLSRLTFIASLCMGCLVALRRSVASRGGTVRLAGAGPDVALALRRAKLDVIFPLDADVASSLAVGAGRDRRV